MTPFSMLFLLFGFKEKFKVHLTFEQIDVLDHDFHLIAKLDDSTRLLANDAEVILVEVIVVARHILITHQAFAFVAFQLHIEAPLAHA